MYIKLSAGEIEKKTGTFYLMFNMTYGIELLVLLGRKDMNFFVSYCVEDIKFYEEGNEFYVEDASLKRALNFNFYEKAVVDKDLYFSSKFNGKHCFKHYFKIPDTIQTRPLSANELQLWYVKSKMINDVPKIEFSTESIFNRIPLVKIKDLEVGKTYIGENDRIYLYLGYYTNVHMFYKQTMTDKIQNFYQENQLIITSDFYNSRYYAGFKKKLPNLYKISDYPETLIPWYFSGVLKCLPKITVCVK